MRLFAREDAIAALDGLLESAREGRSGALVLRGEPGIGLTSLLDYAVGSASDMRVARVAGVESEMELTFAAVHQLCVSMLDRLDAVSAPQRDALASVFGLTGGRPPDSFLVDLAVLSLLSHVAEEQPLLCVLDDAHWLDQPSAEALAFVGRRLRAESVALVFALHNSARARTPLAGLPELRVARLSHEDSHEVLGSVVDGPIEAGVRERVVTAATGNPLALLELTAELTRDQLAGAADLPQPLHLGSRLEQSFLAEIRGMPPETRTLLLLAAAEPEGSASLLWSAAALLGIPAEAAAPAEADRLLQLGPRIAFRHPLIGVAIYGAASTAERKAVHRALVEAIDPSLEPDLHAWHRAAAALEPDEDMAADLERSAARAKGRGDYTAAGACLVRAAQLTPDPNLRTGRTLAAAQAELAAGAFGRANALLAEASSQSLDKLQRAQALRLRGAISFGLRQGYDGCAMLLQAAKALEPINVRLARDTYLEALEAAIHTSRLGGHGRVLDVATAALSAPAVPESEVGAADLLLDGLASLLTSGHQAAVPTVRRALEALHQADELRWLPLGCLAAREIWHDEALHALTTRHVQLVRHASATDKDPLALERLETMDDVVSGRFEIAEARFAEAREPSGAARDPEPLSHFTPGEVIVAVWRGRAEEARHLAEACAHEGTARGLGSYVTFAKYAIAVLEISLGNYWAALTQAREACEDEGVYMATAALPELVEAAVRSGDREIASLALRRLSERTVPSGTDWALGTLARSRALLAEGPEADPLYQEAIEHLERTRVAPHLARTHLAYGEWLRRMRRRRDSRNQLSTALDMFVSMGSQAFAERARVELTATGEHVRRRTAETVDVLTPQEARIARLAGDGASNPEIAAQLFISPRTVEYHLSKVFRKLGVSSRTQLARIMPREG